ncbi:MAG: spinster family MFS transporter [Chthoniobacteraceae bacterium]
MQTFSPSEPEAPVTAARPASNSAANWALGLLLAINLFNYIDRQVLAAVEPQIRETLLAGDPNAKAKTGLLATAFLFSYMLMAPVFGILADRYSRWILCGISVALWSLASGWSGLAMSFGVLLFTRMLVGVGEAGYGPAAPTIISDLFPLEKRGRMLSYFYLAIPVGSALGYGIGGFIASHWGWRWAFYAVVPPGLLLATICFFMRDRRKSRVKPATPEGATATDKFAHYKSLLKIRSYVCNTAAMTAMTFAIGGIAFWIPSYVYETRGSEFPQSPQLLGAINMTFGAICVVAGLIATLLGGWTGDRLRTRYPGSYFLVSGAGMALAFPFTVAMLYVPFPYAWGCIFFAVFFLFFNTGPANAALANVTPPDIRATAFAMNILVIHALGDAISPPLIGYVAGKSSMNAAFLMVSGMMLVASFFWLWGSRYLGADTAAIENASKAQP